MKKQCLILLELSKWNFVCCVRLFGKMCSAEKQSPFVNFLLLISCSVNNPIK